MPHRHGQSPIDLTATIHISDLKHILKLWGPLLSGNHRLYHKPMSTVCSMNALGGKPLVKRIRKHFLVTYIFNTF
jgi:hypothetical protein